MEALKLRRSTRTHDERPLPPQVLSNLLWAAWGINRPDSDLRTAPSWRGRAHVDLYLVMQDDVWIYDAKAHQLALHMKDDLRAETTSGQPFVHAAPLNIVYVADADRLEEKSAENRNIAGVADTAMIGQNSARNRGPCSRVVGRARIGVARACRMGFSRHRRGSAVARRTVRDFGDPTRAVEKLSQISINREGARLIAIPAIRCRPNHANTDT